MPAKKIGQRTAYQFGSLLGPVLTDMLKATAAFRVQQPAMPTLTDNSTGVAAGTLVAVTLPVAFTKTGTDISPKAGFDTQMTAHYDAVKAFGKWLNLARVKLGLDPVVRTGEPAADNTIPAQTKALTAVDGTGNNAVQAAGGITELTKARNNWSVLAKAANEVIVACGGTAILDNSGGTNTGLTTTASAATPAGVDGTAGAQSLSDTVVDAALNNLANNIASLRQATVNAITAANFAPMKYIAGP